MSLVLLMALPIAVSATPGAGGDPSVERFGVLRPFGGVSPCLVLETDQGELLQPTNYGGFGEGDRVWMSGEVACGFAQPCNEVVVPILLDNEVEAAFAGLGRLILRDPAHPVLQTPSGERYELLLPVDFPAHTRLFVEGVVEPAPPGSPATQAIRNTVTGVGFQGFGRLIPAFPVWHFQADTGELFELDQLGIAYANPGDYVFVEGWQPFGGVGGQFPPQLLGNTTRPAIAFGGELIDVDGVPTFKADGELFEDEYLLESTGEFGIGDRVYVRGRGLDDYDPLEPKVDRLIRGAQLGVEVATCGELIQNGGLNFILSDAGELYQLEYVGGPLTPGQDVFVAGTLDPSLGEFVFGHNSIADCWELSGELVLGFECAPYFLADQNAGALLNLFMLENLGGNWLGDRFCVKGATVPGCGTGCPVPCMVSNTIIDCD